MNLLDRDEIRGKRGSLGEWHFFSYQSRPFWANVKDNPNILQYQMSPRSNVLKRVKELLLPMHGGHICQSSRQQIISCIARSRRGRHWRHWDIAHSFTFGTDPYRVRWRRRRCDVSPQLHNPRPCPARYGSGSRQNTRIVGFERIHTASLGRGRSLLLRLIHNPLLTHSLCHRDLPHFFRVLAAAAALC